MTGVFAHIVACLEEQGWKFRVDDEEQVVKMDVKPNDVPLKVRVGWVEAAQHISFMVRDLVTIPEPYRDAACILANMINWQFGVANFEIDMEDGETAIKLAFPVKDGTLGQEQIRFGLGVVLTMAERYYPAFQKLLWAGLSPREALVTADE